MIGRACNAVTSVARFAKVVKSSNFKVAGLKSKFCAE